MFDFLHGTEPYKRSWTPLSFNNLEFGCTRNRLLPVIYDKVIRSEGVRLGKKQRRRAPAQGQSDYAKSPAFRVCRFELDKRHCGVWLKVVK
jgi:hypothetical protein